MVSAAALHSGAETGAGLAVGAASAVTAGSRGRGCLSVLLFAGTALTHEPREENTRPPRPQPLGAASVSLFCAGAQPGTALHAATVSACSSRPPCPHTPQRSAALSPRGMGEEGGVGYSAGCPALWVFLAFFSWACLFLEGGEGAGVRNRRLPSHMRPHWGASP